MFNVASLTHLLSTALPPAQVVVEDIAASALSGFLAKELRQQSEVVSSAEILFPFPANNPAVHPGPTATASAFSSLSPAAQAAFLAANGHIVIG